MKTASIILDGREYTLFGADLGHLDDAAAALKSKRQFTAAERVLKVRELIAAHFIDDDPAYFISATSLVDPGPR